MIRTLRIGDEFSFAFLGLCAASCHEAENHKHKLLSYRALGLCQRIFVLSHCKLKVCKVSKDIPFAQEILSFAY